MIEISATDQASVDQFLSQQFATQQAAAGYPAEPGETLVFVARDGDAIVGALVAKRSYRNVYVDMLAVDATARHEHIGSRLLAAVEAAAKARHAINVTLTTKSFQAKDFYLKNGYTIFGELADTPFAGVTKYYFVKRL
ncbi:GNAT family N-acetyltransferase [Lacticaseibacillus nasuensis]|uniref:GNAT family N-acetyltransferase n=1 Tax=Lacticaseibacillus nasuensis TaxID=944671 RepID=UPI002247F8C5|nr:GNAT family N-acetyltransferase [Lacticaseibacillus nasuensis]MCX2455854.1 GNAT family N-acetyltransferase [Lacticaseibacillus nasuensis]